MTERGFAGSGQQNTGGPSGQIVRGVIIVPMEKNVPDGCCRVSITIQMPNALFGAFLQTIRTFEQRDFDHILVLVSAECPTMTTDEVAKIHADVDPPYKGIVVYDLSVPPQRAGD